MHTLEITLLHRLSTHKYMFKVVLANNISLYLYSSHVHANSLGIYILTIRLPYVIRYMTATAILFIFNRKMHTSSTFKINNMTQCDILLLSKFTPYCKLLTTV